MTPALVPELLIRELASSLTFYEGLGFAVLWRRPGFACVERAGARLMLEEVGPESWITGPLEPPLGRGVSLEIAVEDAWALQAQLKDGPFRKLEEVWYRVGERHVGVLQFLAQDPDGYLLRFQQTLGRRDDLEGDVLRNASVSSPISRNP